MKIDGDATVSAGVTLTTIDDDDNVSFRGHVRCLTDLPRSFVDGIEVVKILGPVVKSLVGFADTGNCVTVAVVLEITHDVHVFTAVNSKWIGFAPASPQVGLDMMVPLTVAAGDAAAARDPGPVKVRSSFVSNLDST